MERYNRSKIYNLLSSPTNSKLEVFFLDYLFRMIKESFDSDVEDSTDEGDGIGLNNDENFSSKVLTVRSNRPEQVRLRVGDVVVNTRLKYVGIITGWLFKEVHI